MCRVVVASSAATSMLHEIREPEMEVAASISVCDRDRGSFFHLRHSTLLMGHKLRTHFDLTRPSVASCIALTQDRQKAEHDRVSRDRTFEPGGVWVFVKNRS